MKKQYTTPAIEVINYRPSEVLCVSATFGEGTTPDMHSNLREEYEDYILYE